MTGPEDEAPKTEPNLFKRTLEGCRDSTIPNCRDNVYDGTGSPVDSIATPISNGGWECNEADTWVQELRERCNNILDPFDDAVQAVRNRIRDEDDPVPENDWRGYRWSKLWSMQRNGHGPI